MSSSEKRIKESAVINADMDQPPSEAWDVGSYKEINALLRVFKAGTSGFMRLQHAAVNRDDAYVDIVGTGVDLSIVGDTFIQIKAFLRYVRWRVDSGVAGNPVALIDAVAKN